MIWPPFALLLCLVLTFAGCASYTAKPVPEATLDGMPSVRVEGPLALGIDPYLEVERQSAVFDEKLGKEGVLAIQVTAENRGPGHLVIRHADMTLEFPDGRRLTPVDAAAAAAKFEGDATSDIGPAIAFGLVGIFAAMHARQKANSERVADYQAKEFGDVTIGTAETKQGFVYFIAEDDDVPFSEATLVVPFLDAGGGKTYVARMPLRGGARSQPSLPAREAPPGPTASLTARPPARPSVAPGALSWPSVGSSWVLSERASGSYGSGRRQVTVTYDGEKVWEGKKIRAFSGDTLTTYVDDHRRILARVRSGAVVERFDPYFIFAHWPLRVGKWWPNRFRFSDYTFNQSFDDVQYDGQVEALENVRTPAGTFKAFRISLGGTSSKNVYWYSSDVGLVIKHRVERFANHYLGAGMLETELVSYDFKP